MEVKSTCHFCGKEYIRKNGKTLYCSDECKKAARKAKDRERYKKQRDKLLAQSKAYYQEHKEEAKQYQREWNKKHPHYGRDKSRARRGSEEYARVCPVCGKEFKTCIKHKITCSTQCEKKKKNKYHNLRQRGVYHGDDIQLLELFYRDEGICHICGGTCDFDDYEYKDGYFVAGNSYPSVDHIKPISKGGAHEWGNVKLAHRVCNAKRGNREWQNTKA